MLLILPIFFSNVSGLYLNRRKCELIAIIIPTTKHVRYSQSWIKSSIHITNAWELEFFKLMKNL